MTSNSQLIYRFLEALYKSQPESMSNIISPFFMLTGDKDGLVASDAFLNYVSAYAVQDPKLIKIVSLDDVNFLVTFSLGTIDNTLSSEERQYAVALIVVQHNLIQLMQIKYNHKMKDN